MSLVYEKVVQEDLNVGTTTVSVTNPSGGSKARQGDRVFKKDSGD